MSIRPDEDHRAAPLVLRNLREILGQPQQGGDSTGIVARRVEPAIAMGNDINRFVGGTRQSAPHQERFLIRHPFAVQAKLHVRWIAGGRLGNQIANQQTILGPEIESWHRRVFAIGLEVIVASAEIRTEDGGRALVLGAPQRIPRTRFASSPSTSTGLVSQWNSTPSSPA